MLQPLEDLDLTGNIHAVWAVKGGDVLCGEAGDWLMQYAPGDHGIVAQDRFERVYRVLDSPR